MKGSIIVGLDLASSSQVVFDAAVNLAADLRAKLVLVHAFSRHAIPGHLSPATSRRLDEMEAREDESDAVGLSTEWAAAARARGLDVRTDAREGRPANVLLEVAEEMDGAMVVVGAHGGRIRAVLLGSTAQELVRSSKRPVLVIPVS